MTVTRIFIRVGLISLSDDDDGGSSVPSKENVNVKIVFLRFNQQITKLISNVSPSPGNRNILNTVRTCQQWIATSDPRVRRASDPKSKETRSRWTPVYLNRIDKFSLQRQDSTSKAMFSLVKGFGRAWHRIDFTPYSGSVISFEDIFSIASLSSGEICFFVNSRRFNLDFVLSERHAIRSIRLSVIGNSCASK